MSNESDTAPQPATIIITNENSSGAGVASFILGLISIFILSPLLVPIAILLGIIAIIKKQYV